VEIVDFVTHIARGTGMHFNINLGTFIPKPHTPYQWIAQIDEAEARKKLDYVRYQLKSRGHKVGIHDPFIAVIEGVLSRGDGRVGELLEEALRRGCRLDAWNEYVQKDIWRSLFEEYAPLVEEILGPKDPAFPLPWDCIDSGLSRAYFNREYQKSETEEFTLPCMNNCTHPCGICGDNAEVVENNIHGEVISQENSSENTGSPAPKAPELQIQDVPREEGDIQRVVFSFSKQGTAVFLPHLGLVEVFSMALIRTGIPVLFSRGFNPLPRIDFASPLSIGISADAEIATVDIDPSTNCRAAFLRDQLNRALPRGLWVVEAAELIIPRGLKKHSAASLLWGYGYTAPSRSEVSPRSPATAGAGIGEAEIDYVPAADEKKYRLSRTDHSSIFGLTRKLVLAKSRQDGGVPESYFSVYRSLYRNF
jgi:hypothetical protein